MNTRIILSVVVLMAASALQAQTVVIDSLDSNGKLTATVPSNAVYSVEWKGALDSTNDWQVGWSHLRDVLSTNGVVEVEVPMAFRLTSWTNGLFLQAPIGRTFHYSVTNQVDEVWRQEITVLGDIYIPQSDKTYRTLRIEEFYQHADFVPLGAQSRSIQFMRSEEDKSFHYDPFYQVDVNDRIMGNSGTVWSYFSSSVETTNDSEVIDNDVLVTIGTTNYPNCLKISTEGQDNGFDWQDFYPIREYTEWIKPGGYVVKRENYWIGADETNAAPVVYELQGWTDQ